MTRISFIANLSSGDDALSGRRVKMRALMHGLLVVDTPDRTERAASRLHEQLGALQSSLPIGKIAG
jgi:hypothetical protein